MTPKPTSPAPPSPDRFIVDLLGRAMTAMAAVLFPRLPPVIGNANAPKLDRVANINGPFSGVPPGKNLVLWSEKCSAQLATAVNSSVSHTIQTRDNICIVGLRVYSPGSTNFQAVPGAVLTMAWTGGNAGSPFPTGEGLPTDILFTGPDGGPWICPMGPLHHTNKGGTDTVQFTVTRKITGSGNDDVYILFCGYSTV